MTTSFQAEIPDQLLHQAAVLIRDGWAANIDEILSNAQRRYLDSHSAALSEAFIREDLEWGLRGRQGLAILSASSRAMPGL
jgi:hypothetical protein